KPHSFDQASLSETIRQAKLGDSAAFEKIYRLQCWARVRPLSSDGARLDRGRRFNPRSVYAGISQAEDVSRRLSIFYVVAQADVQHRAHAPAQEVATDRLDRRDCRPSR